MPQKETEKINLEWTSVPYPFDENGKCYFVSKGGKIEVDPEYWKKLQEYIIDTEKNKDILESIE